MQRLEVSGGVRFIYVSLGVNGLTSPQSITLGQSITANIAGCTFLCRLLKETLSGLAAMS